MYASLGLNELNQGSVLKFGLHGVPAKRILLLLYVCSWILFARLLGPFLNTSSVRVGWACGEGCWNIYYKSIDRNIQFSKHIFLEYFVQSITDSVLLCAKFQNDLIYDFFPEICVFKMRSGGLSYITGVPTAAVQYKISIWKSSETQISGNLVHP